MAAQLDAERDHGQLFLWLPVAAGIGAAGCFALPHDPSVGGLAGALTLALAILAHARIASSRHWPAFLLLSACLAGALAASLQAAGAPVLLDSDVTTEVTGRVEMREVDASGRMRYLIAVEATDGPRIRRPPGRVRLVARAEGKPIDIGSRIRGRARLSAPSGPALPGGYDFGFAALSDGIGAHGFFFQAPVELTAALEPVGIRQRLAEATRSLRDRIATRIRSVVPGDAGAIAATLAVSDRRGISEAVVDHLRATGLAHILAISGLHMALAAGTLYVGLRRAMALVPRVVEAWPVKKLAASGALLAATVYLVLSGASVPTQRAWLMLMTMLVAVLLDRPALTMRNVALAALIIIMVSPAAVVSPGFQMSFAATAALIAAYGSWAGRSAGDAAGHFRPKRGGILGGLLGFVAGLLMTSLVAGLATGLFATYHFHRIAAWGTLANLLAMPLMTLVVMPSGLVALLLMPFGLDAWPLRLMGIGLDGVIAAATWVDSLGGDIVAGQVPFVATAIATSGFIVLVFLRSQLRLAGAVLMIIGGIMSMPSFRPSPPDLLVSEDGKLLALVEGRTLASNASKPSAFVFEQWQRALRAVSHQPPEMNRVATAIPALSEPATGPKGRPWLDAEVANAAPAENAAAEAASTMSEEAKAALEVRQAAADLADLLDRATLSPGRFACRSRGRCVAVYRDAVMAAIADGAALGPACDIADLVVVSIPLRIADCRSGATLVTARSLRLTGALAVRIVQDVPDDGDRTSTAMAPHSGGRKRPTIAITPSLDGAIRPWTIQRYYDWRTGRYETDEDAGKREVAEAAAGPVTRMGEASAGPGRQPIEPWW